MRTSGTAAVSRRLFRAAAVLLVCVFASLPTLIRLHERLSAVDDVARFRLSKNIERPHEKQAPAALIRIEWLGHDLALAVASAPAATRPLDSPRDAATGRAPPFSR